MRPRPLALFPIAILLLACGGSDPKTEHNTPTAEITKFTIEPTTIPKGGTATLIAEFREGLGKIEGLSEKDKETKPWVFEVMPDETTTYTLRVSNAAGKAAEPKTVTLTVMSPDATITAPTLVGANQTGYTAKVPDPYPEGECTYAWSISSGQITSETNTQSITFTAPASGVVALSCTVTNKFHKPDTKEVQIPVESSLDIDILGLPKGVASDVILSHPDGKTEAIKDDFKLKNPVTGTYTVTAKTVLHQGLSFHPWQPEQKFTIAPNAAVSAKVQYPLPMYVAMIPDASDTTKRNKVPMEFVLVPAGEFNMGSSTFGPIHKVTFNTAFYMARTECTQEQWRAVTNSNPSMFQQPGADETPADVLKRPVERVTWSDVNDRFLLYLNDPKLGPKLGPTFQLPSEAQWEYACRATRDVSNTWEYFFGPNDKNLNAYSWNDSNAGRTTHPVGTKDPNPWGICDIIGNVWEWCADDWHPTYDGAPHDGSAWKTPSPTPHPFTFRGGGWWGPDPNGTKIYSSAFRLGWDNVTNENIGFRLVINEPQFENKDVLHGFGDADVPYYPGAPIAVDPTKTYKLSADVLAWPKAPDARIYIGVAEYDKDMQLIEAQNHMYHWTWEDKGTADKADDVLHDTTTILVEPLTLDSKVVVLKDITWWEDRSEPYHRGFIFWNTPEAGDKPYPVGTYSRNVFRNCWRAESPLDKKTHKIFLNGEWRNYSNQEFPAGTIVSQNSAGNTYRYCTAVGVNTPSRWVTYPLPNGPSNGIIGGIDKPNGNDMNKFTAATRFVRPFFLGGYNKITGETVYFCNWKFDEVK